MEEDDEGDDEDDTDRGMSMPSTSLLARFKLAAGSGYVNSHCCFTLLLSAQMPASPNRMKGAARRLSVHCDGANMDSTAPMAAPPRKFRLPGRDIEPYARQSRRACCTNETADRCGMSWVGCCQRLRSGTVRAVALTCLMRLICCLRCSSVMVFHTSGSVMMICSGGGP